MEPSEIIKQTWQQMVERLNTRFSSEGYEVVHFQNDDMVFGSCYIMWSNNEEALRLTWDGKECWFILEETILPIQPLAPWSEIATIPFDPDVHDTLYAKAIIDKMIASLD